MSNVEVIHQDMVASLANQRLGRLLQEGRDVVCDRGDLYHECQRFVSSTEPSNGLTHGRV